MIRSNIKWSIRVYIKILALTRCRMIIIITVVRTKIEIRITYYGRRNEERRQIEMKRKKEGKNDMEEIGRG